MSLQEAMALDLETLALWCAWLQRRENREYMRAGVIAATVANFAGKQATRPLDAGDFFQGLSKTREEAPVMSVQDFQRVMGRCWRARRKKLA